MGMGVGVPDFHKPDKPGICPQLPGTVLRIFIPPGFVINVLNIVEVVSPAGICLIVRLPFLGHDKKKLWDSVVHQVQQAGGTIEVATS